MRNYTKTVIGLSPVADAFAGTVASDIVNFKNYEDVTFIIVKGVGTTGTSTITVEACDDTTPSNTTALAFKYQSIISDTESDITSATTSGFTTTAGSNQIYKIYVNNSQLAASGYKYIRLKAVESANDPVLGGIIIQLENPRLDSVIKDSVLS